MRKIIFLLFQFFILQLPATNYYVSPNGQPTGNGSKENPYNTIEAAVKKANPGDIIYLTGGIYSLSESIKISRNGTVSSPITIQSEPDTGRPILDFSGQPRFDSRARGIVLSGDYWHIIGLDIIRAGDNGLYIDGGNHNTIEFCTFYENGDTGLQIGGGATYNLILNCDSYYNADEKMGNADGFACKTSAGTGNKFQYCRAWMNSDDGYDGYLKDSNDITTIYEGCYAFMNGMLQDGTAAGDGNGFKMGGCDAGALRSHNAILKNCVSAKNKKNGFDRNSNIGSMTLYNCTAYANEGSNYIFVAAKEKQQDLEEGKKITIKNCISVSNTTPSISCRADQIDMDHNTWNEGLNCSTNDFVSLNVNQYLANRDDNGNLPDFTCLHLKSTSLLIDKGIVITDIPYNGNAPDLGAYEYQPGDIDIDPDGPLEDYVVNFSTIPGTFSAETVAGGTTGTQHGITVGGTGSKSGSFIPSQKGNSPGSAGAVKLDGSGSYVQFPKQSKVKRVICHVAASGANANTRSISLQYSTDGINFIDVTGGSLEVTNDATGKTITANFDGIQDLIFRLISRSSGWNIYDFIVTPDNTTSVIFETETVNNKDIYLAGDILYLPENKSVVIYNISGKCCYQNRNISAIDFSNWSPGYYIVRIKDKKGNIITTKIIH
ncbi:right-handed parallel beta-helix repeat-containing protein [Coprobacter sp.]